jgi:hypothetical protein
VTSCHPAYSSTLKMATICSSKTSGSLRTALSYNPDDRTLPSYSIQNTLGWSVKFVWSGIEVNLWAHFHVPPPPPHTDTYIKWGCVCANKADRVKETEKITQRFKKPLALTRVAIRVHVACKRPPVGAPTWPHEHWPFQTSVYWSHNKRRRRQTVAHTT